MFLLVITNLKYTIFDRKLVGNTLVRDPLSIALYLDKFVSKGMLLSLLTHLNSIRPIVTAGALVAVSPTVFIVHSSWCISSILLPWRIFYKVEDAIWGWYQNFVVFVFENCLGIEIICDGAIPNRVENVIFICNHQSAMDWIVADMLAIRQGMVGHMRYVFKNVLKYVPLFGYVFGMHGGVFVRRDGTYNANKMQKILGMLSQKNVPLYLVIYPEGTRYNPKRQDLTAKSQAYAIKNSLKPLKHVLAPRVKAFHSAVSGLDGYLDAVYDATIIYDRNDIVSRTCKDLNRRPPTTTLWDVVSGRCKRIYVQFDRIEVGHIPVVKGLETATLRWLHHRFELKDAVFDEFYTACEEDKRSKTDLNMYLDKRTPLSSANAVFPSIMLIAVTTLLVWNPVGRKIYLTSVFGGTLFGIIYSHFMF